MMFEIFNLFMYAVFSALVLAAIFQPGSKLNEPSDKDWVSLMTYITLSCVMCYYVLVGAYVSLGALFAVLKTIFMKVL